jgi:hypothetical protein
MVERDRLRLGADRYPGSGGMVTPVKPVADTRTTLD